MSSVNFEFSYTNAPVETVMKVTEAIQKGEIFGLTNAKGMTIVFAPKHLAIIYPSTVIGSSIQVSANMKAFESIIGMSLYRYNVFTESQKAIELTPCHLLN